LNFVLSSPLFLDLTTIRNAHVSDGAV
jgi:hypothetical protein